MIHALRHFLLDNGIGQNVTASGLLGIPASIWVRLRLVKKLAKAAEDLEAAHRLIRELHEHHLGHRESTDA